MSPRLRVVLMWAVLLGTGCGATAATRPPVTPSSASSVAATIDTSPVERATKVRLPQVVDRTLANAKAALRRQGFEVRVKFRAPIIVGLYRNGTVMEQRPQFGPVREGRTITLIVSREPPCTPGYTPCLPPASDYDCAGGEGNGPEYVYDRINVRGYDPYDLDDDYDGYGCDWL